MRVLLVTEKRVLRELLAFFLEARHLAEVTEVDTAEQGIETLTRAENGFDLVLCAFSQGASQMVQHVFGKKTQMHFALWTDKPPSSAFFEKFKDWFHFLKPANLLIDLNSVIKTHFAEATRDTRPEKLQFSRVKTRLLPYMNPLPGDVYVRLGSEKFLRMIPKGDFFDSVDLNYFQNKKRIAHLYIRTAESVPFAAKLNAIVAGKAQVVNPPEGHVSERARLYEKEDKPEPAPAPSAEEEAARRASLQKARDELLKKKSELENKARTEKLAREIAQDLAQSLDQAIEMGAQLGFTKEVQEITKTNVLQTIALVKKAPKLSEILEGLRRERGKYISSHSMMLAHVSCALATQMEWTNDMTYQKLTLASFLHDTHLTNHDLAQVKSIKELEDKADRYTAEEMKAYREHPMAAAENARKFTEVPPDVDSVIAQHHEKPDGSGFPRGLTAPRIAPLSTVFIVAHDLVQFLLTKESMGNITPQLIEEFIRIHSTMYSAGNFRKVLAACRSVKS